jgi:hypothetical protein
MSGKADGPIARDLACLKGEATVLPWPDLALRHPVAVLQPDTPVVLHEHLPEITPILPPTAYDATLRILGLASSMDHFVGRHTPAGLAATVSHAAREAASASVNTGIPPNSERSL